MDNAPRDILRQIVGRYGTSVCEEPKRCENLLLDLCGGNNRREAKVLALALREGIVAELICSSNCVPKSILLPRLAKRMYDDTAMMPDVARWAVESWALVLGVVGEEELSERSSSGVLRDQSFQSSAEVSAGSPTRPDGGSCSMCVPSAEAGWAKCKYCGFDVTHLMRIHKLVAPRVSSVGDSVIPVGGQQVDDPSTSKVDDAYCPLCPASAQAGKPKCKYCGRDLSHLSHLAF